MRERSNAETHIATPHSHYPCADGRWVAIACTNDKMFARLARVMGQPELAGDERFRLNRSRLEQQEFSDYLKAYPPEQGTEPALTPVPHLPMMLACARSG